MEKHYGKGGMGGGMSSHRKGSAAPASMTEKSGFPGAQLPGKAQSKSRNAGVKGCKVYADSKGI